MQLEILHVFDNMDEVRFQIDVLHGWYYIFVIKDIGYIGHWTTHEDSELSTIEPPTHLVLEYKDNL